MSDEEYPCYFRIMTSADDPNKAVIVEMQAFDEIDYDSSRYITKRTFDTHEEAVDFCQEIVDGLRVPSWMKDLVRPLIPVHVYVDQYLNEDDSGQD